MQFWNRELGWNPRTPTGYRIKRLHGIYEIYCVYGFYGSYSIHRRCGSYGLNGIYQISRSCENFGIYTICTLKCIVFVESMRIMKCTDVCHAMYRTHAIYSVYEIHGICVEFFGIYAIEKTTWNILNLLLHARDVYQHMRVIFRI